MGGAAENRAGAIFDQNEVCHIDRQRPVRVEGVPDPQARVETLLLRCFDGGG